MDDTSRMVRGVAAAGGGAAPELPALGAGLGFRPPFRADLFRHRTAVDFLEITADHYLAGTPEQHDELDLLAAHFPLIPHALDLSLGSADGIDPAYLDALAALLARIAPPWWSEHLAFTRAAGIAIGHLAALPFTAEAVEVVARNVETVRRVIGIPLILENITVGVQVPGGPGVPSPGEGWDEAAFLTAVLRETGCGWLCDVTNLHSNAVNHGIDPGHRLDRWPWDRVVQMHVAGGHRDDGVVIDSHAHPVAPEVWQLVDAAVGRSPVKAIIIERDDNLPPFADLAGEVATARAIGRRHARWR